MFTVPAIRMADAQVQHNPDLWMYRFDWRTPARGGAFGAHHFLEVPFAFDQIDNAQAAGFLGDARPHAARRRDALGLGGVREGRRPEQRRHCPSGRAMTPPPGRRCSSTSRAGSSRRPAPTRSRCGTACSGRRSSPWSCTGSATTATRQWRRGLQRQLRTGLEVGASVAVTVDGEPVVDMWAGDADPRGTAVGARHDHQRVLDDQDHGVGVHAHAGRPRTARFRRARRSLLARVRPERQGGRPRPPRHEPHGRRLGVRSADHRRRRSTTGTPSSRAWPRRRRGGSRGRPRATTP